MYGDVIGVMLLSCYWGYVVKLRLQIVVCRLKGLDTVSIGNLIKILTENDGDLSL